MSTFDDQLNRFVLKVETKSRAVFVGVTTEVQRSVVFGSELTSAPGQPVDTGNLRDSWIGEFLDATTWQLTTNVDYAQIVEENVRGVTFKNHGPRSVLLTVLHFPRIVAAVAAREPAGNA
jgi:hypothetical protein